MPRTYSLLTFCALQIIIFWNHNSSAGTDVHAATSTCITIASTVFTEGGMIPTQYTCDGKDISPPLSWTGIPAGTKSFALICDDPDAPTGTWVHWVLFNIPSSSSDLPQGVPSKQSLEGGAIHGINDFKKHGYGGPCPPGGTHRYYFRLYALDTMLSCPAGTLKKDLLHCMKGHILAKGCLMGRYAR